MTAPTTSFTDWILKARALDENMKITLKADETTPYPVIEKVMKDLVHIKANRYSFITVAKRSTGMGFNDIY